MMISEQIMMMYGSFWPRIHLAAISKIIISRTFHLGEFSGNITLTRPIA